MIRTIAAMLWIGLGVGSVVLLQQKTAPLIDQLDKLERTLR